MKLNVKIKRDNMFNVLNFVSEKFTNIFKGRMHVKTTKINCGGLYFI